VLFEGTAVRAYEGLAAWRRSAPVRPAGPDLAGAIAPHFATLRAATTVPGPRAELLAATSSHALVGVAAAQTQRADLDPDDAEATATDVVVATALGPASVAERARAIGRTPDELRRTVAEETSLPVHELVIRTRIARAQQLLATTDQPVGSVARQVGYDDPAYFSRLFAARVGASPTAFRRQAVR
jgi:AraC-like DNA-binding protein